MNNKDIKPTKLLWIDLEMTGLDPEKDRILEAAVVVTDFQFKQLALYEAIVKQPFSVLNAMNEWAKIHHGKSGLLEKVPHGEDERTVHRKVVELVKRHFDEPAILAGNSIHQDRLFIRKWWPDLEQLLHYRMLDVSSFKVLMRGAYGVEYPKADVHRAKNDIDESIKELQFYINKLAIRS